MLNVGPILRALPKSRPGRPIVNRGISPVERVPCKVKDSFMVSFHIWSRWCGLTMRSAFRVRVPLREASNPTTRLKAVLGDLREERIPARVTA